MTLSTSAAGVALVDGNCHQIERIEAGVIEGTCRYLVADRMDITGARWSVEGAEAILKLRAVRCNGDFDDYWRFHLDRERHRVHETRYENEVIPLAA